MNRRVNSKSTINSPDSVAISSTVTCDANEKSIICPAKLGTGKNTTIDIKVMIDCSAEGNFIDRTYTGIMGIKKKVLTRPIVVKNVDGTLNQMGTITHYVNVTLELANGNGTNGYTSQNSGNKELYLKYPGSKRKTRTSTGNSAQSTGEMKLTHDPLRKKERKVN